MKKILFLLQIIAISKCLIAQSLKTDGGYPGIPIDSCNFDGEACSIMQPIDSGSIWEIGKPSKAFLDAAYSPEYALITDDTFHYKKNLYDFVQFALPDTEATEYGQGYFEFWHKYDFDSAHDGGLIKISFDSLPFLTLSDWLYYTPGSDTLFDGYYCYGDCSFDYADAGEENGFTGRSDGWVYTKVYITYWVGVKLGKVTDDYFGARTTDLRFYIASDSIAGGEEGWAIDNFGIGVLSTDGDVKNLPIADIKIYPNPVADDIYLYSEMLTQNASEIIILNMQGVEIMRFTNQFAADGNIHLHLHALETGTYLLELRNGDSILRNKFIKM